MLVIIQRCIKKCSVQEWNFKKGDIIFITKEVVEKVNGKDMKVSYTVDNERLTEKDLFKYFEIAGSVIVED